LKLLTSVLPLWKILFSLCQYSNFFPGAIKIELSARSLGSPKATAENSVLLIYIKRSSIWLLYIKHCPNCYKNIKRTPNTENNNCFHFGNNITSIYW
jgi:hypothetical protein